jgi:hypothetical protein
MTGLVRSTPGFAQVKGKRCGDRPLALRFGVQAAQRFSVR